MAGDDAKPIEALSAITLATADMRAAVRFYESAGFRRLYGGEGARFTSFAAGTSFLNLIAADGHTETWWGRAIFHVDDVDAMHHRLVEAGYSPAGNPADAPWGERYFHITDPDGHEISFARPLGS